MVGNDIASAPARRAAYSISAATSVSFTPGRKTSSARVEQRRSQLAPRRGSAPVHPHPSPCAPAPPARRIRQLQSAKAAPPPAAFFLPRSGARLQPRSSISSISSAGLQPAPPARCSSALRAITTFAPFTSSRALRVIANIGEENAPRFLDREKTRAPSEAAEISDVGEMADQQGIEPRGRKMLPQFILACKEVHAW